MTDMRTVEYEYFQPPFARYNIAQSAVIPFADKDVNMVVAFATAVGKTVVAECCFGYHLSTDEDCRVAYVAPSRSLCSEKYEQWKADSQFAKHGLMIGTGDHIAEPDDFKTSRLAVVTSESFDSKTRNRSYRWWLSDMACVVFDEAHLLGDRKRGGAVEAALMRLSAFNPQCRLILLSATLGNAMEVAKWLKSLNGKRTKCAVSDWRPNVVNTSFHMVEDGHSPKIDEAIKIASSGRGKTVVFVHSKAVGGEVLKGLKAAGVRSAFHNASLKKGMRQKIERAFNEPDSGLNVLVSTATLAAGVNIGDE